MRFRAAAFAALIAAACGSPEAPTRVAPQTSVFIVSIDTLRSDRLSIYGDKGAKTPAFERFRKDAILFEHAFTHVPLTLPAHTSLLTGRLPHAHRVRDNAGYPFPADMHSLQATLRASGYATGAAVSSSVLRRSSGIARDFDFFDDSMPPGSEERTGHQTREALTRWIAGAKKPAFGLLHIFEPHTPYEPTYHADVTKSDAVLGSFLEDLERAGLYRDSLIIVLSDHGEGLGDHGEEEHGVFLYRESIQIPLLVKLPNNHRAGETVARSVALVDVFPTVLDALGLPPVASLDGLSLLKDSAPRTIYSETFFPRLHLGWSESFSLLDDSLHYIDAPRSELYRYRSEPAERTNVIADERRSAAAMRAQMERIDRTLNPPGAVSAEERRSLAALGYLGSGSAQSGPLPDAKDRIRYLRVLKEGYAAFFRGDAKRAAAILEPLTREAPELSDAWAMLAESQVRLGDKRAAMATLRSAGARFPSRGDVRVRLAELLIEARDIDGATREIDAATAIGVPVRGLNYQRSIVLLERGRVADAEAALRREVETFPDHVEAWGALAAVLAGQGRVDDARSILQQTLKLNPTDRARQVARDTLSAAGDREGMRLLGLQ